MAGAVSVARLLRHGGPGTVDAQCTTPPGEHHYSEAEQGLAQRAQLGLDKPDRLVQTLVALVHATLAIAAGTSPAVASS